MKGLDMGVMTRKGYRMRGGGDNPEKGRCASVGRWRTMSGGSHVSDAAVGVRGGEGGDGW